jgi:hypothetical protein
MRTRKSKKLISGAAFVAAIALGTALLPSRGRADNDNNGAQDEKQMIEIGLQLATTTGIPPEWSATRRMPPKGSSWRSVP